MMLRKRKARVLTRLKISEISAVDKGAGEGVQIMLMKRASDNKALAEATVRLAVSVKSIVDDDSVDKNDMLAKTFAQFQQHLDKLTKNASERAEPDLSDSDVGYGGRRRRRRDDDENYTERLSDDADADRDEDDEQQRNKQMQTHSELMSDVVKKYGIVAFCKSVEQGDVRVSEHDLTKLIDEQAKREKTTFSKLFERPEIWKAVQAARDAQWLDRTSTMSKAAAGMPGRATLAPRVTGGRAARAVDNPKTALAELQALVDEQRAQHPELSESAAWLAVYTHPDNVKLAQREREENRPVAI
jgi:hypothetical protein